MILRSLELNNFKQYTHFQLDFRPGLTGIIGKNGAGKSTIFEAVLLCLYGLKSGQKDFVRSSWATKKDVVRLELIFEQGGKVFRILREFRGKDLAHQAKLFDQNEELIATADAQVSKEISKLLGMDRDAFTHSIFTGQKELGQISRTTGEQRRKLIRRMVGLDKLDDIQKKIREDRNGLKKNVQGMQQLVLEKEDLNEKVELTKTKKKEIKVANTDFENLEKTFKEFNGVYLTSQKTYAAKRTLQEAFQTAKSVLDAAINKLKNYEERHDEESAKLKTLQQHAADLKELLPKAKKHESEKEKIEALVKKEKDHNKLAGLQQERKHYAEAVKKEEETNKVITKELEKLPQLKTKGIKLKDTIESLEKDFEVQTTKREEVKKQIDILQGKINDRTEKITNIQALGKDADCPTCLQPLVHSYDNTLDKLKSEIEQYEKNEITKLKAEVLKIEQVLKEVKVDIKKHQEEKNKVAVLYTALLEKRRLTETVQENINQGKNKLSQADEQINQIGDLKFNPAELDKLREKVSKFTQEYIGIKKLENEVSKIPAVEEKITALLKSVGEGKKFCEQKDQEIKDLKFDKTSYDKAFNELKRNEELKDVAQKKLIEKKEGLSSLKNQLEQIENVLKENEKNQSKIKVTIDEQQLLDELDGIFISFKKNILERIRPIIAQTASDLFKRVTRGKYESILVDANFDFHIYDNGNPYPINRFSGGEVDLANLCLRIGVSKAIAEISGTEEIGFLGFDEIFGSQDEERREQIMQALEMLKEQYRQIYIISHVNSVKDDFPNVLEVRAGEMGSNAVWY